MRLLSLIAIIFSLLLGPALADGHGVVNVYSARHYDSDVQLYEKFTAKTGIKVNVCLLYTSPSPRDDISSRMPSSA